jgi:hypothetical protein
MRWHLLLLPAVPCTLSCSRIIFLQAVSCRAAVSCKPRRPRQLRQR